MVSRLYDTIPQDQLQSVLAVLDSAMQDYDITRKPVTLVPASGLPEVVKYYLASKAVENMSQGTLKIYRLRLEDFFKLARKPFSDVRANDIRMYLYYCKSERHASDAYLDNIRRILSAFFSWLVANEYIVRNPCASIDSIKYQAPERTPLTSYELEELRWVCRTVREKALVDLLFSSGIRASECSAVNLSDIDWKARSIIIRHGKGDKRRVVYFNAESELSLRKYLETRQDDCEALFVTIRAPHHRLGIRSIETEIGKIGRRCEHHVFPHKLRHTFATSGLRGGMPLDKLQALMGHAKPETTLIYAKQDQTDLQREHSRVYA
jgi:integrase/recombinase XerD